MGPCSRRWRTTPGPPRPGVGARSVLPVRTRSAPAPVNRGPGPHAIRSGQASTPRWPLPASSRSPSAARPRAASVRSRVAAVRRYAAGRHVPSARSSHRARHREAAAPAVGGNWPPRRRGSEAEWWAPEPVAPGPFARARRAVSGCPAEWQPATRCWPAAGPVCTIPPGVRCPARACAVFLSWDGVAWLGEGRFVPLPPWRQQDVPSKLLLAGSPLCPGRCSPWRSRAAPSWP